MTSMNSSSSASSRTSNGSDNGIFNEKPIFTKQKEWVNTGTPDGEIKVFHPTMEEFANFPKYIEKLEREQAHLSSGVCKVIPPKGWSPRPSKLPTDYSDVDDFIIESPVRERIESIQSGCYVKNNTVYRKSMHVSDFRHIAMSKQYRTPTKDDNLIDMERSFWRNLLHHEPIYAADTPGSIYDPGVKEFNMNNLGTILDMLKDNGVTIKGVNTVFLYFGMWKTMFPWHAEDMDLYSINYLHFGEPKFWYSIPPAYAEKFERLAAQRFPDGLQICKAFLRHKLYIVSPTVLKSHGIPFGTMVQYPNEFMITFPKGYHMGFNVGYNCAESTNFALERWIDYGKNALLCYCRNDTVEIDMQPFMKKYRPDEYREWFEYWYGERPTSYKPQKIEGASVAVRSRRRRKGSQETKSNSGSSAPSEVSNEDDASNSSSISVNQNQLPTTICTKRMKKIHEACKPMSDLWANQPVNLYAEKQHNEKWGKKFPHCNVCQYFFPRVFLEQRPPLEKLPESSRRYVTDQMFNKHQELKGMNWEIIEDELVQCSNCLMVVHRNCYPCGVKRRMVVTEMSSNEQYKTEPLMADENAKEDWLCERCYDRDDTLIRSTSCKLCELRGGALVRTQQHMPNGGNDFVHVICALMDRNTRFLEPRHRRAPFSPPPRKLIPPATNSSSSSSCSGSQSDHDYTNKVEPRSPAIIGQSQWKFQTQQQVASSSSSSSTEQFQMKIETHHRRSSFMNREDQSSTTSLSSASKKAKSMDFLKTDQPVAELAWPSSVATTYKSASSSPMYSTCKELVVSTSIRESSAEQRGGSQTPLQQQQMQYPASYQCEVCGHQADEEVLIRCDTCVSLDDQGAKLRFHITCAPLADVTFERRHFPECAIAICSFHSSEQGSVEDQAYMETPLRVNQRVIVNIEEEGLVGKGRITKITEHLFTTVDFLDGSFSSDIFMCDIKNCECKYFGCNGRNHVAGSLIYVDWIDKNIYQAYYRGNCPKRSYKVRLFPEYARTNKKGDDIIEIDSESIFRESDRLPENVRLTLLKRTST